jgi:hypothetical protein
MVREAARAELADGLDVTAEPGQQVAEDAWQMMVAGVAAPAAER